MPAYALNNLIHFSYPRIMTWFSPCCKICISNTILNVTSTSDEIFSSNSEYWDYEKILEVSKIVLYSLTIESYHLAQIQIAPMADLPSERIDYKFLVVSW